MDAIPGRYTQLWFTATKLGTFHLFCAEDCGTKHSGMVGSVTVMAQDEFQTWLSGGPTESTLAQAGEKLFSQLACVTCHASGDQQRGPVLNGFSGRRSRWRMVQGGRGQRLHSRVDPQPAGEDRRGLPPLMPTFQGQVSEEQLLALTEYIKSLPPGKSAPGAGAQDSSGTTQPAGTQPAAPSQPRQ